QKEAPWSSDLSRDRAACTKAKQRSGQQRRHHLLSRSSFQESHFPISQTANRQTENKSRRRQETRRRNCLEIASGE
ncbi:hypothetical protein LX36DRAFT_618399, partial [Colletotrichum falcatum]